MNIRQYFSDFRYLASNKKPQVLEEFVKFEEVKQLIKSLQTIDEDKLDKLTSKYA